MSEFCCVECGSPLEAVQDVVPQEIVCPRCSGLNVIPPTETVPTVSLPDGRVVTHLHPGVAQVRLAYLFRQTPWYRRHTPNSLVVLLQAICLLGCCFWPLAVLAMLLLPLTAAVCVSCLTGPIYYRQLTPAGRLRQWSRANKVAAVLLLVIFLALPVFVLLSGMRVPGLF